MLIRVLIACLSIFTLIAPSLAQTADRSAEEKSLRAALQILDPQKKIAALEAYMKKYPQGMFRVLANRGILETLLEYTPGEKDQILAQSNRLVSLAGEGTRGSWSSTVAGMLLEKDVLLEEAERFAQASVAELGNRKNLGQQQQIASGPGRVFLASNVPRVATLGRIYLKRGKVKEAESLLKEAYGADATSPSALLGMGELATLKGDHKAALNYFAEAYLSGRGREAARKRVDEAYQKLYPGKSGELEVWLDAKYRKDDANPIKAEAYKSTPARTNRVVLAEVFTGSSCGPCVATDLAFEAALARYNSKELSVLMYHVNIPDVDPLTNPTTESRKEFYGVRMAPSPFINGVLVGGMGGGRARTAESWEKLTPMIEKGLDTLSEAAIRISAMRQGPTIKVKVGVEKLRSSSANLRLHLALVEDEVRYMAVNGIRFHPMVVRAMAGEKAAGWAINAAETPSFDHTFELQKIEPAIKAYLDDYELNGRSLPTKFDEKKYQIDANKLSLVAFVQDNQTKQILQAVYLKLPAAEKTQ